MTPLRNVVIVHGVHVSNSRRTSLLSRASGLPSNIYYLTYYRKLLNHWEKLLDSFINSQMKNSISCLYTHTLLGLCTGKAVPRISTGTGLRIIETHLPGPGTPEGTHQLGSLLPRALVQYAMQREWNGKLFKWKHSHFLVLTFPISPRVLSILIHMIC